MKLMITNNSYLQDSEALQKLAICMKDIENNVEDKDFLILDYKFENGCCINIGNCGDYYDVTIANL